MRSWRRRLRVSYSCPSVQPKTTLEHGGQAVDLIAAVQRFSARFKKARDFGTAAFRFTEPVILPILQNSPAKLLYSRPLLKVPTQLARRAGSRHLLTDDSGGAWLHPFRLLRPAHRQ